MVVVQRGEVATGEYTWTGKNKNPVRSSNGQIVGFNRYLTFTRDGKENKSVGKEGHWTMHEYSLPYENDYVLCKITKEVTKSERTDCNVRLRYSMIIKGLEEVGRIDQDQRQAVDSQDHIEVKDSGKRKSSTEFSVCDSDRYFLPNEFNSNVPSVVVSGSSSTCKRFTSQSDWVVEDLHHPQKRTKIERPILRVQPLSGISYPRTPTNVETAPYFGQGFGSTVKVRKERDEVNVSESSRPTEAAQQEDVQHLICSIQEEENKVEVSVITDSYIQVDDIITISDDEGHLGDADHDDQPLDKMGEDWGINGWNDELFTYLAGDDDKIRSPDVTVSHDIVIVSDDEGHFGGRDSDDQPLNEMGEDWETNGWNDELSTYMAGDNDKVRSPDVAVHDILIFSDDKGSLGNDHHDDQPLDEIGEDWKTDGWIDQLYTHFDSDDDQQDAAVVHENTKSNKPGKGVSLTEWFTPDQVREHIASLKQWVGQSKANAEKNRGPEPLVIYDSCALCEAGKLTFKPLPIQCAPCGASIKRNALYYTVGAGKSAKYFCVSCHNGTLGDNITIDGSPFPKAKLDKKKNDKEIEEEWVQCDKCKSWQHQICALFNSRRNEGVEAEYTCPSCYIAEIERGERTPLPQSTILGANDLPRTILSDHLEQRLLKKLKLERKERARMQGKTYDEVPGAECLVIRVVSSVDKKVEVKQRFREIFQDENYPNEFGYKSKVVLLFQKIEGVDVCLFAMYVHEFGADCQEPNRRRVYLSYLDSVKYFRPEITAVTGEALRTYVYHEILIGYLDYCKKRGFTSCYIWACPPPKGDDYILYCHPEIQKTPKTNKLREWYSSMLKKAAEEKIVVELTNLYDHLFVPHGASECKTKVTAARLPYFDGDYLPAAAEDIIFHLEHDEDGGGLQKKGMTKKTMTKRAPTSYGQDYLSGNALKDVLLMHKLGEKICRRKEDFIMVHLQHSCSHCCTLMTSGSCWVCSQCTNFKLCDKCHEAEQKLEKRCRHPINNPKDLHMLYPVEVSGVPVDTEDKDETLESEIFDTRLTFLGLCEENNYQFDTIRRAKHSSMMILYHLHNQLAPPVCNCL